MEPGQIWQGVLTLNAAMWAATFLSLWQLVGHFFADSPSRHRTLALAVTAVYPTWLTMSGYAFPTTIIVLVFLLSVIAALRVSLRRWWSVIPHSVTVGYLYWIHPTGLAIAVASVVALAIVSLKNRGFASLAVHVAVVSLLLVVYREGLHQWLLNVGSTPDFSANEHYPSYLSMLAYVGRPEFWFVTFVAALGQVSYLTVGSLGLAVCGFVALTHRAWERLSASASDDGCCSGSDAYASLFPLFSMAGVILMGSASFAASSVLPVDGSPRVDQWIYGRYAEGVLPLFLAFGVLNAWRRRRLPLLAGGLVVVGALLTVTAGPVTNNNLLNTTAFWPQYVSENPNYLLWMSLGALGGVVFQVVSQLRKTGKAVALVLLLCAYVLCGVGAARFHAQKLDSHSTPTGLVEVVRTNYESGTCVGFNPEMPAGVALFHRERYQLHIFYLYDYTYRRMTISDWLDSCDGPLLTYQIERLRDVPDVVLLGQEVRSGLYFVAKEREQGFLIPDESPKERTFYPADGWSIQQSIARYGKQLTKLPTSVGELRDGAVVSTGLRGHLVYGPYVAMNAGEYHLVVKGIASSVSSASVDVTSSGGKTEHAKYSLSPTNGDEVGILASGTVVLKSDVLDLEVRVFVGATDDVRLTGYELTPASSTSGSRVASGGEGD